MLGTLMSNQSDVIEQMDSKMEKVVITKSARHYLKNNGQSCTQTLLIGKTTSLTARKFSKKSGNFKEFQNSQVLQKISKIFNESPQKIKISKQFDISKIIKNCQRFKMSEIFKKKIEISKRSK